MIASPVIETFGDDPVRVLKGSIYAENRSGNGIALNQVGKYTTCRSAVGQGPRATAEVNTQNVVDVAVDDGVTQIDVVKVRA